MKLQLKSPDLWLLFQRCVAEVKKTENERKGAVQGTAAD